MTEEITELEETNLTLIRDYLGALERGDAGDDLSHFFTSDACQIEFPNRLNVRGNESDLESILARSVQGKGMLSSQRYTILNEVVKGDRVAVEAQWDGKLAVPIGQLAAGFEMRANFAMFFECREGRIVRQHNYDCFEPW